jgi:hypothetical protein
MINVFFRQALAIFLTAAFICGCSNATCASEVTLKDGRVLTGKLGKVSGLAESPQPNQSEDGGPLQLIILLDDELRRTFFSERLVREVRQEENKQVDEMFGIRQRVQRSGQSIQSVGQPLRITPFDEFGRLISSRASPS